MKSGVSYLEPNIRVDIRSLNEDYEHSIRKKGGDQTRNILNLLGTVLVDAVIFTRILANPDSSAGSDK